MINGPWLVWMTIHGPMIMPPGPLTHFGGAVHLVEGWLAGIPPGLIYLIVGAVIGVESLGIPLPGEIVLVSAALFATGGNANIWWVAVAASLGAIVGDSIGYAIGRRGGRGFLERLGRRFPKHMGPKQLARVERTFHRWGVMAIFFGRFVALLRVLAGPVSGALRIPYPRFLIANVAGGIVWAGGTAFAVFALGKVAEQWLSRFSWVALVVAVIAGIITTLVLRKRAERAGEAEEGEAEEGVPEEGEDKAAEAIEAP